MTNRPVDANQAIGDAVGFARLAWRRLWGVQALAALGVGLAFVSARGRMSPALADDLADLGWLLVLISAAPLWAGLFRLSLGGKAARDLGPLGLQFGRAELRLMLVALASFLAAVLAWLPVVGISAIVFVVLAGAGSVPIGPLGDIRISFIVAASLWLVALAAIAWASARLAFAAPATIGKRRLVLLDAWTMTEGRAAAILWSGFIALAPLLLTLSLLALVNSMELQDAWGSRSRWPLPDAVAGGLLLGLMAAFVQAPLSVGVLGHLYRAERLDRIEQTRRLTGARARFATAAFVRAGR